MKVCYCDESGMGDEPIAVMVGVVVDSQRMHVSKDHWQGLLTSLSEIVGRTVTELHTNDFYSGNGVWRELDGEKRSLVLTAIISWLKKRKHDFVYAAVLKEKFRASLTSGLIPAELSTLWRFLGFHLILAMQKAYQSNPKNKGNTIFVFDNQERERLRFADLINNSPAWSHTYYKKKQTDKPLNQIIDVPYFGDSREVSLIQVADVLSFLFRKYAELHEGLTQPRYSDELQKVTGWVNQIKSRSVGRQYMYPAVGRCSCAEIFYSHAPESIRLL